MSTMRDVRVLALIAGLCAAACGGPDKKEPTTPGRGKTATGETSEFADPADAIKDGNGAARPRTADPSFSGGSSSGAPGATAPNASGMPPGSSGPGAAGPDNRAGGPELAATPSVSMPNYDPDPAQARTQVEQHLQIARNALGGPSPDADTALREARLALDVDAASIDAAAMVAFAYYHKKLYDTAELVLDDLFKRDAAKQNAGVYYVYGLVYDRTNRVEQAVLSYRKAVELNPNHASAWVNLGVHQLQNTQYAEALRTFERLVNQFGRGDVVTLTSLGSAYRGHAADYPATSPDHDDNVRRAEAAYKRALQVSASYGPAYYNLGLLYLDNDPFPGLSDTLLRLNTSKTYFDQYKNMPGVDMKLYDDRMKDVTKAIKRAEKQLKKPRGSAPVPTPASTPAKARPGSKRGGNP